LANPNIFNYNQDISRLMEPLPALKTIVLEEVHSSDVLPSLLTLLTLHPHLSIHIKAYNVHFQDMLDDYYTFLREVVSGNLLERLTVSNIKLNNYYDIRALVDVASSTESLIMQQTCHWLRIFTPQSQGSRKAEYLRE
jgi:hypothetical protein